SGLRRASIETSDPALFARSIEHQHSRGKIWRRANYPGRREERRNRLQIEVVTPSESCHQPLGFLINTGLQAGVGRAISTKAVSTVSSLFQQKPCGTNRL